MTEAENQISKAWLLIPAVVVIGVIAWWNSAPVGEEDSSSSLPATTSSVTPPKPKPAAPIPSQSLSSVSSSVSSAASQSHSRQLPTSASSSNDTGKNLLAVIGSSTSSSSKKIAAMRQLEQAYEKSAGKDTILAELFKLSRVNKDSASATAARESLQRIRKGHPDVKEKLAFLASHLISSESIAR